MPPGQVPAAFGLLGTLKDGGGAMGLTLGVTGLMLGATGLTLGVTGLTLGVTGLMLGATGLTLGAPEIDGRLLFGTEEIPALLLPLLTELRGPPPRVPAGWASTAAETRTNGTMKTRCFALGMDGISSPMSRLRDPRRKSYTGRGLEFGAAAPTLHCDK